VQACWCLTAQELHTACRVDIVDKFRMADEVLRILNKLLLCSAVMRPQHKEIHRRWERSLVSSSSSSFSSSSTVTVMLPLLWFNLWFKVARATADFFYKSLIPPFVWSSWLVKRWLRDLRSAVRWSSSILTLLGLCAAAPQRLSPRDPCRRALRCICMFYACN
jgi:hypothetical protein